MNYLAKSSSSQYLRGVTKLSQNNLVISNPVRSEKPKKVAFTMNVVKVGNPFNRSLVATTNLVGGHSQVRFYTSNKEKAAWRTDLANEHHKDRISYRYDYNKDVKFEGGNQSQTKLYLMTGVLYACTIYTSKYAVREVVDYMGPGRDAKFKGSTSVDLEKVPEGKSMTFKYRDKPLFIRHRTPAEIAREEGTPMSELKDPQLDSERCKDPRYLICMGVCTHLGCVPIANSGDYGGYYCPCHGSHYDASGRIRRGPAPSNLEVPPYVFDDKLVTIG